MNDPLLKSIKINCAPDHAFATFTEKVDLWWPRSHRKFERSTLTLDATPGGQFTERASDGRSATLGDVISCTPPQQITFTWNPGKITGPTEVTITFQAQGDATVVHVEHIEGSSDLGDAWETRVALFAKGWTSVLAALQSHAQS